MPNTPLSQAIADYISNRLNSKQEKLDKEHEKNSKKLVNDPLALTQQQTFHAEQTQALRAEHHPRTWLSNAAKRAKQITVVTHALKFTHSDAKGNGCLITSEPQNTQPYLSTHQLNNITVDIVGNAAALDVAGLLLLEANNQSLLDAIRKSDIAHLQAFAESEQQCQAWLSDFQAALTDDTLASHTLAKQLYFPITKTDYHLIAPLHASSLSHSVYERINESRFGETAKAAREARKNKKHHESEIHYYPTIITQSFGGTKPQNVSQLNSKRRGKTYLLSCQPPTWENKLRPLTRSENQFFNEYNQRVKTMVAELRRFLIAVRQQGSNLLIRDHRANLVDELIDQFLMLARQVQQFTPGWSARSKLPYTQQLWLDPKRDDIDFQNERAQLDWQADIAKQFARWLNKKLTTKVLLMDLDTQHEWQKLVKKQLSMLKEDLEVMA
jgi:CRISPR-associated protein Csy1